MTIYYIAVDLESTEG